MRTSLDTLGEGVRVLRPIGVCPYTIEPTTVLVPAEALKEIIARFSTTLEPIASGKPVYGGR